MTKPSHEIRRGGIKAAIWANENEGRTLYSVKIVRVYKEKGEDADWRETSFFNLADLAHVRDLAQEAQNWIAARTSDA